MSSAKSPSIVHILALACAIWFLLTSWMWAYLGNLFISFPVGLAGLLLWLYLRRNYPQHSWNRIVAGLLLLGTASALVTFCLLYFRG